MTGNGVTGVEEMGYTTLAEFRRSIRGSAGDVVKGNPHWTQEQQDALQAVWGMMCGAFDTFIVSTLALYEEDNGEGEGRGEVKVRPGIMSNGNPHLLIPELVRWVVENKLIVEFALALQELMSGERGDYGKVE